MFSKLSRYKKLTDVVTVDAGGRLSGSKSIRLLPKVSGTFFHTVEEPDRLDHLAFKYYRQSRKWWRICDANPSFLSPLGILGDHPIAVVRFHVSFTGGTGPPPWCDLLKRLSKKNGVTDVLLGEIAGAETPSDDPKRVVTVTYNRLIVETRDLKKAIEGEEELFDAGDPEHIGRVGKKIVIPPDVTG